LILRAPLRCLIAFKSAKHTRILRCVSETVLMKTIDSLIDFLDRVTTPRMTDTQIEIIENKLLDLEIEGEEAARRHADLYRSRLNWEETRSSEQRQNLVDQAQDAQAWLEENSL
jgi:hypothetical protein